MTVVVVGTGLAGTATVAALRAHNCPKHLIVIGDEGVAGYDRPPLSRNLLNRLEPVWLAHDLGADIEDLADQVWLYRRATGLTLTTDVATVHTDSGDIHAEVVVAASGSRAHVDPALNGAAALRTLRDAQYLRGRIGAGKHLVIAGAGWVGTELAATAAAVGAQVSVIESGPAPLHKDLPTPLGENVATWMRTAKIAFWANTRVTGLDLDGTARVVQLRHADGTTTALACDEVVAATGVRPATDWLQGQVTLDEDGYVPVNHLGQAAPRLFAVGDIAVRNSARFGLLRGGHWDNALRSPEVVARALTGVGVPPGLADPVPFVSSRQFGHHLAIVGAPRPGDDVTYLEVDSGLVAAWIGDQRLHALALQDAPHLISPARRACGSAEMELVTGEVAGAVARMLA